MATRTKREICHNCNVFHISCMGELFKRPDPPNGKGCISQVNSVNNIQSDIQVAAFNSLFKAKRRAGMDTLTAFAEAVVHSSDEVFARAKLKRPHLIRRWKK